MLAKLGLVANLYWLSSQFDVEPTQGDKLNGITCTAEGGGGLGVGIFLLCDCLCVFSEDCGIKNLMDLLVKVCV